MSRRRLVSFAGSTVELIERGAEAGALVRFLFGRFPPAAPATPCLRFELASDAPATFILWRDGSVVYRGKAPGDAARLLLAEVMHGLSAGCLQEILLHAAAVAVDGRGILLPGRSGSGKSTLAAWLDHRGFACLSDEMMAVSVPGAGLHAFVRPICLEPDANLVIPDVVEGARREGRLLEAADALLVMPRSPLPPAPVALDRLIFPRYVRRAETTLRPLTKSAAAILLMGSVTNAHRHPDHGFSDVSDLVRRVPAFELHYDDLDACLAAIMRSLESVPAG
jgi:hypothetical protein